MLLISLNLHITEHLEKTAIFALMLDVAIVAFKKSRGVSTILQSQDLVF
jgi:hypothetical protein